MEKEKKNVTELIKQFLPAAVDIISDKLSKEDNSVCTIDKESKDYMDSANDIANLAVGMIKYVPIDKINKEMDRKEYTVEEKIAESYMNGFSAGFSLACDAYQEHLDYAHKKLSDVYELTQTAKQIVEDTEGY